MERLETVKGHLKPSQNRVGAKAEFGFTREGSRLSSDQRRFYEDNGYLLLRKCVPEDELDEFGDRFRAICEGRVSKGGMTLMKDPSLVGRASGEKVVNKLQDFMYDDVLFRYCTLPQVLEVVRDVIGPNVQAMHTMLINKPPEADPETSEHPLHQDLHYFPFRPADRIVCAWTAMERVTPENGCLVVLPASHKTGRLLPHEHSGANQLYHGILGYKFQDLTPVPMNKGDTVFFHPILIHGSGPNRSQGYRKAISCHYAASECAYIDVRGTSQESIAREAEAVAKKRGVPTDYISIWKYRSRLVAGQALHF